MIPGAKARCLSSCGLVLWLALSTTASGAPGDWPELRQNAHLTAVQPLPGRMPTAPTVLARYDLGRSRPPVTAVALPDAQGAGEGHVGLCIVAGALRCYAPSGGLLWQSHPPGLNFDAIAAHRDLDGDGAVEVLLKAGRPTTPYAAAVMVSLKDGALLWRYDVEPMSYAWYLYAGSYLPGAAAEQIVVIMHGYPPDKDNGYMVLFEFPRMGERPVRKWRYDFDKYTCFPSFLDSDLDGDGVKELVVETHSRMWFLDAVTGAVKHFAQWDVSPANVRSYGLVEFVDLNQDGREDFLCIADFAQHHEVLLNQGGQMRKAWGHGWSESVTTGKVATTWPDPPYADLDADGCPEIIVSMFNAGGKKAWLLRAYDALTGDLEYRAPGLIAVAVRDLDGDGAGEVLANACQDATQSVLEGARLLKVREGGLLAIWGDDSATALKPEKDEPFVVERAGERAALALEDARVTLRSWAPPAPAAGPGFSAVPSTQGPAYPSLLAGDVTGDGQNEILLYQEPDLQVLTYRDGAIEAISKHQSSAPPVIADLDGDGAIELVLCTITPEAAPFVEALSPVSDNTALWRTQFPRPGRPGLPQPRKAYVRAGRFTGKPTPDVYVWAGTPVVRSVVLDGRTGEILWDKGEAAGISRYWGPSVNLASAHDFDGDGNEDLVFTNPDYYCVASGPTGEFLLGPLFPPKIFNQPSQGLYTLPAILEHETGDPTVCLVAGHYFHGVMSLRAEPRWYRLPVVGDHSPAKEGFLRLRDGSWVMGFGRQNGDFACVGVADGVVRWETPLKGTASDVIACDVDGDGQGEFLFGTSHGSLYALGDAGAAPRLVWKLDLGAAVGAPIAADINRDAASEIIVPTADGYVHVLGALSTGQTQHAPPRCLK